MSIFFNNRPASAELQAAWAAKTQAENAFLEMLAVSPLALQDAFEDFLNADELVAVEQSLNDERTGAEAL